MQAMASAMQYQQNALQSIEDRVTVLEGDGHTKKKNGMTKPELTKLLNDFGVN